MPPPTVTHRHLQRIDVAAHRHLQRTQKKKKTEIDLAIGGGRDPPQRPRKRDPATPQWPFLSFRRTQKKSSDLKNRF
jgi:hypothetical protein